MQFPFEQLIFQILICCCCSVSCPSVGNEPFKSGSPLRRIFGDRFVQQGRGKVPAKSELSAWQASNCLHEWIRRRLGVIRKAFDELSSEMCHRGNERIRSTGWIMPLLHQFIHQSINQMIMAALITVSKPQLKISSYQPFINTEWITLREDLKCFFLQ